MAVFKTNKEQYHYPLSKRISHFLLQYAQEIEEPGLVNGKTGLAIYFFLLFRHTGILLYEHFAYDLMDDVVNSINTETPVDFENGLAGIGWTVEFLLREGFIDGDRDEILEEFDEKIIIEYQKEPFDTRRWIGYGLYFISRLENRSKKIPAPFFLTQEAIMTIEALDRYQQNTNSVNNMDSGSTDICYACLKKKAQALNIGTVSSFVWPEDSFFNDFSKDVKCRDLKDITEMTSVILSSYFFANIPLDSSCKYIIKKCLENQYLHTVLDTCYEVCLSGRKQKKLLQKIIGIGITLLI